jgi:putative transposase
MDLDRGSYRVGQNLYHFEWCPKHILRQIRRRQIVILQSKIGLLMLRKEENRELCESILREVAERHGIEIVKILVIPDHVHLIASIPPTMSISDTLRILKAALLMNYSEPNQTSGRGT